MIAKGVHFLCDVLHKSHTSEQWISADKSFLKI